MTPDGDRLVPGSPQGVPAGRAPLIDVTPLDSASGVECVAVTVVWDVETRAERDDVWIYRNGAVSHTRTREGAAPEAVGRDENAQPEWGCVRCGYPVTVVGTARCAMCFNYPGTPERHGREQGRDEDAQPRCLKLFTPEDWFYGRMLCGLPRGHVGRHKREGYVEQGRDAGAQPGRRPVSGAWLAEGGWAVRQNNRYSGDDRGEDGAPAQDGDERDDSAA